MEIKTQSTLREIEKTSFVPNCLWLLCLIRVFCYFQVKAHCIGQLRFDAWLQTWMSRTGGPWKVHHYRSENFHFNWQQLRFLSFEALVEVLATIPNTFGLGLVVWFLLPARWCPPPSWNQREPEGFLEVFAARGPWRRNQRSAGRTLWMFGCNSSHGDILKTTLDGAFSASHVQSVQQMFCRLDENNTCSTSVGLALVRFFMGVNLIGGTLESH